MHGSDICEFCTQGKYFVKDAQRADCPEPTKSDVGALGVECCYCDATLGIAGPPGGPCVACPVGKYSKYNVDECVSCPIGMTSPVSSYGGGGADNPMYVCVCEPGHVQNGHWTPGCSACVDGQYIDTPFVECQVCPADSCSSYPYTSRDCNVGYAGPTAAEY